MIKNGWSLKLLQTWQLYLLCTQAGGKLFGIYHLVTAIVYISLSKKSLSGVNKAISWRWGWWGSVNYQTQCCECIFSNNHQGRSLIKIQSASKSWVLCGMDGYTSWIGWVNAASDCTMGKLHNYNILVANVCLCGKWIMKLWFLLITTACEWQSFDTVSVDLEKSLTVCECVFMNSENMIHSQNTYFGVKCII